MKKIYLLIMLIASLPIYGSNNDLKEYGLKGKVKNLEERTYNAVEKFGEIEKGILIESKTFLYNKYGDVIENYYNKSDESDGSYYWKWIFKYDSKGNKIEKSNYGSDGIFNGKWIFKYDSKGNKIEEIFYYFNGSLGMKWIFKYDSKGNTIEKNYYNSDGSLDSKWTFKYDSKGNMIEENNYNSDGSLNTKGTYKYDSKGNRIEVNANIWNGNSINPEYKYKEEYKYKYDNNNNWIKETSFRDGKPLKITERKIVYFGR